MKNQQLSELFAEMGDIMEILGEDTFRVATYRKVARVVGESPQDVATLAAEGRLTELPGVGKSSAEKIEEFVHTGSIHLHRELRGRIPPGLLELLRIPGLGPKGVAALWKGLGVSSLSQLRQAIEGHRVETLTGFGEKKAAALLKGLSFVESSSHRVLLAHALGLAEWIAQQLRETGLADRVEVAGSVRRGRETIGDIDILATAEDGKAVVEAFTHLDGVEEVLQAGDKKASIRLGRSELCPASVQVDLRVVPAESFGAAWQYFTGSKYHNVRLRELAGKKHFKLNEYGLFRGEKRLAGATEEEIYDRLGLAWVPPTLREDRGEVDRAGAHDLPRLVEQSDIRGDLHMHSPASDGRETIEVLAKAAKALGYKYIAITDHSGSSVIANGLDADRLRENIKQIRKVDKKIDGITILAGAEVDIHLDGTLDYPDELLAELDWVIASVHSGLAGSRERSTTRLLEAMANPYVNCIGHPTGRMLGVREGMDLDVDAVITQAARTGTALEVSASPLRLDLNDEHCRLAVDADVKLAINTDAHESAGFGQVFFGLLTAQRGWVTPGDVVNCMTLKNLRQFVAAKRRRK